MKLIVNPHTIEIVKDLVNEKEIDITKCEFEFADEITDDYVKEAYFTYNGTTYKQIIQNNECKIPYEVLENKGMVEIGVVAYKLENDEYVKRYNPSPAYFNSLIGSLKEEYENSEPITPTDKEQIEQALNDGLNDIQSAIDEVDNKIVEVNNAIEETNNLNIDVNKVDKEATIELTKKDGTQKEVKIYDGVSLQFMWQGTSLGIKTDDMQDYVFVNLQGIQGVPGPQGEPFRIKKTYSSVAEMNADFDNMNYGDYVMIASSVEVEDNAKLYTRGELQWIFITDFSGATGIKGETGATPNIQIGNVISGDTPNVTRTGTNENPILNFTLVKGDKGLKGDKGDVGLTGNGISSVRKTSTSGLVDTYTITFTNGTTTTFDITNGEDGEVTQAQLDKVQQELDYYKMLENALPKVEGEGETIHLEDTAQCPMKLGFKGQIQQDSTTGKNKLENKAQSTTTSQVTITKNNNGTISLSGTASSNVYIDVNDSFTFEAGQTYILNGCPSNGTLNTYYMYIDGLSLRDVGNGVTISVAETTSAKIQIKITSGVNTNGLVFKPMISTSGGDYEPYTGESPSPSPSYPQDIHIVSGDNTIKIQNRNLFSSEMRLGSLDNSTGQISANNSSIRTKDFIQVQAGETYTISNNKEYHIYLYEYDSNQNFIQYTGANSNDYKGKHTFVLSNATKYIKVRTIASLVENDLSSLWQLEKGSTFTDFVERQEQSQLISLPVENLFDKTDIETGKYYKTSAVDTSSNWAISQVKVQPNTSYYLSGNNYNNNTAKIVLLDSSKNILSSVGGYYDTHLITTSSTTAYIGLSIAMHEGVDDLNTIQLEKGTKANSYTPYGTTPIEVGGIGDYEDEFFKNTIDSEYYDSTLLQDKWYLKKRIGKVVLDGSENWNIANTGTSNWYYRTLLPSQPIQNQGLSNYYLKATISNNNTEQGFMCINSDRNLRIRYGTEDTITNYKAWLSTHNLIVCYILATPTNTLLNDTLQETLDSFYSMQGQTNISQENNDLPFVIKASAIRDMTGIYDI